jgi:Lipocalin-like domain
VLSASVASSTDILFCRCTHARNAGSVSAVAVTPLAQTEEEIMHRRTILTTTAALIPAAVSLRPSDVFAQQKTPKDQMVGSWEFVSVANTLPDGSKVQPFGASPVGLLMFGSDGRYISLVVNHDIPKFASNSREKGTPEENKAAVQGGIAHFGTYSEADGALIFNIERSTFPNWNGTQQKRPFTLTGDELK